QKKCLQKAGSAAMSGRTVLLVSHNLGIVTELAGRAMWLDRGQVREIGPVASVVSSYLASERDGNGSWKIEEALQFGKAYVCEIQVYQGKSTSYGQMRIDEPTTIELRYIVRKPMPFCRVGLMVGNSVGTVIFSTAEPDDLSISPYSREPGEYVAQ